MHGSGSGDIIFAEMGLFAHKIAEHSRRPLAAFMAVWLSGFVFLFCCDMTYAAPAEAPAMSHCHKAALKHKGVASVSVSETSIECCSILPAVFDKSRKVERTESTEAISAEPVLTASRRAGRIVISIVPSHYSTPLPDLHKSYIKNRVLRI